jgi:hypothetical protein
MIDEELQALIERASDRRLQGLEADIWARLGHQERATQASRRLLWLQAVLLLFSLAGSLFVGRELARQRAPDSLAVFSERLALVPAASPAPANSPSHP